MVLGKRSGGFRRQRQYKTQQKEPDGQHAHRRYRGGAQCLRARLAAAGDGHQRGHRRGRLGVLDDEESIGFPAQAAERGSCLLYTSRCV